jgi:hypothetical protein
MHRANGGINETHGPVRANAVPKELLAALKALQTLRGSTVYLFSPEPISIHDCTYNEVREDFCGTPRVDRLDVILNSGGGELNSAFKIARAFRRHAESLTFFVPRYAKSAATLIALTGNEIAMLEEAELGPLDTQVPNPDEPHEYISALNGFKALESLSLFCHVYFDETVQVVLGKSRYRVRDALSVASQIVPSIAKPLFEQVNPHGLGLLSSALDLAERYATVLAEPYGDRASSVAQTLVRSFPTHDYVIDLEQAVDIGLRAREATEQEAPILRAIAQDLDHVPVFGFVDSFRVLGEEAAEPSVEEQTGQHDGNGAADLRVD